MKNPLETLCESYERDREELEEAEDSANEWRRLALQFDGHRMQALGHLRAMTLNPHAHMAEAMKFLGAGPISGEDVLAERIASLAGPTGGNRLTDAQIDEIMRPLTVNTEYSWRKFARAIESAHGINAPTGN